MAPLPMAEPTLPSSLPNPKQKPARPLLRRATVNGSGTVRTRDEAGLDLDLSTSSSPPSPSKKARTVTFSPVVEEKLFSQSKAMTGFAPDLEAVRVEVKLALEEHIRGVSDERYDTLKEVFGHAKRGPANEAASSEKIRTYILALTNCVSLLGKGCAGLVKAVLGCEWMGRDEGFVKIYVHFLGNLASAQGSYVSMILSALVGKFVGLRLSSGRLEDCPVVSREYLISRVHMALKYLLRLIPSASGTLAPILSSKFPFSEESTKAHISYINSLRRVIEYAPELKTEVFALITERLVKIDVQMQTDLDDLDDEVAAKIVQAISSQPDRIEEDHDTDDEESDADTVTSDESLDNDASRIKEVQENVEKMDAILDTLFLIYDPYFRDPNSLLAQNMFDTLLSHFRNIILPTYRSRHTQFLLFHFAQTSEHMVDTFAGECVELAFKSGRPAVLKQSAAAYLASFVARGAHVLPHVVRDVFDYIGTCLDTIRDENEQTCRGPDLQRYGTFYATTQALLYIFCFRWRDLLVSSDIDEEAFDEDDPTSLHNLEWHSGVKELLWRTIHSKLNPLKICAPSIVEEFARIAVRLDFMIVYTLLETNKRIRLSQFALGSGGNGVLRESAFVNARKTDGEEDSWHMLDAYFPFDPYQLPVSRRWIASDYVEWKGIPGDENDRGLDGHDDGSTNDDEDEDGADDGAGGGVDLDDEDLDTATDDDDEESS